MPSVTTTTIPAASDVAPLIAIPDLLFATSPKGNPSIVFLGDSIGFEFRYGTGSSIWNSVLAPLGAVGYGVPGQTTQSLLYQLSLGQLTGISPFVAVLEIGGNNLLQHDTPLDTAEGVLADVAMIHQYLPQTQVLVLGILPGMQSPTDPYRVAGTETNALVNQMLAGDPHATFVDIGSVFVQPDGTISDTMMFDYLHPTTLGYFDFTLALWPAIQQAFQPGLPAIPSLAPPPPSTHVLIVSS